MTMDLNNNVDFFLKMLYVWQLVLPLGDKGQCAVPSFGSSH